MKSSDERHPAGTVLIGTRGSALALSQTDSVIRLITERFPSARCQARVIRTHGDASDRPLPEFGLTGIFTREIGRALIRREIHLAVHSLKDLPSVMFKGTMLAAVPEREDPSDWLLSRDGAPLEALPEGAAVGTGSARRRAQLLRARPDLRIVPIRGNVDTRLRKLERGDVDAVVLAASGLLRLGRSASPHTVLPLKQFLPAPAQGALGVEIAIPPERIEGISRTTEELAAAVDDAAAHACTTAERALTERLGGGCNVALGALCTWDGGKLTLRAELLSADGRQAVAVEMEARFEEARPLGFSAAEALLKNGGEEILRKTVERR